MPSTDLSRPHRGPSRSVALARSLGWLFLSGSVIGAVALELLPLPAGTDRPGTLGVMLFTAIVGGLLLALAERLPSWVVQAVLALGTAAVSVDIALSGGHTVGDEMFYLWTGLCAFYFCTRRQAGGHLAFIAVGYAVALQVSDSPEPATRWVIAVGSLAGMWLVIDRLVTRLERAARQADLRSRELVVAERRFRSAFDDAATGMMLGNMDGTWLRVNHAFAHLLGYDTEEMKGLSFRDVTYPDDLESDNSALAALAEGRRRTWQAEKRYLRKDGGVVWVVLSVSVVRDDDDRPIHYIAQAQDITQRKRAEDDLAHQAVHDPLTGLPNRVLFLDRLDQGIARLNRRHGCVSILFLDLDRFKLVNDSFGHNSGDEVIALVAGRLRGLLRPEDTLARFEGDEFTILCESEDPEVATTVAERVAGALSEPVEVGERSIFLSASIGIARTESASADPERLLAEADAAMYRAKEGGRSRYAVFDPGMRLRGAERLEIESGLRRAIERDEFVVHYQPQVELATGRVSAVEALVRWQHPTRGLVPPLEFIGVAEDSRLILPLGAIVLQKACHQAHAWRERGLDVRMAVNLSPRQLADPDIVETVARALDASRLEASALCLEITENAIIDDIAAGLATLKTLKDLGLSLAIDDFGVGFSSLNQVRRLSPVDVLKIDRSFIAGLERDGHESQLVAAVIGIARALELTTVAEGIESPGQAAELRRLGCEIGQGYLFARPGPAKDIERLMVQALHGELLA